MRIPLWHKIILFAVFFAAIGVWWLLVSATVNAMPMWAIDLTLLASAFFCGVALGPGLTDWLRQKFGRSGLPRRPD